MQEKITSKELNELLKSGKYIIDNKGRIISSKGKKNKFNAKKDIVDGITFDSTKEANYYLNLKIRKLSNDIKDFKRQVKFPVEIEGELVFTLVLDFVIENNDGTFEYVDVKGYKKGSAYRNFINKKKTVEKQYNIKIREV